MTPRDAQFGGNDDASIRDVAAAWVVRHDRGLSKNEAAEFERWLRVNPRHADAFQYFSSTWNAFDGFPAAAVSPPADKIGRRTAWQWTALGGLAASVCVLLYINAWRLPEAGPATSAQPAADFAAVEHPRTKELPDGSFARLNTATAIREQFTTGERRVQLLRGEAHFTVTKDPDRPFVVYAGNVAIRAVGTAFNVNLKAHAVEVLVTEGKVRVETATVREELGPNSAVAPNTAGSGVSASLVKAGQRALVTTGARSTSREVLITETQAAEIARALAWCEPVMTLDGATLADVCAEFGRRTGKRLVLRDPALGALRMGGRFPVNDVEGFVRALEQNFGIKAERRMDGSVMLDRAP